jgi:hypothetical protein
MPDLIPAKDGIFDRYPERAEITGFRLSPFDHLLDVSRSFGLFRILNFGHCDLFEICILVLEIFMMSFKRATLFIPDNFLPKRRRTATFWIS